LHYILPIHIGKVFLTLCGATVNWDSEFLNLSKVLHNANKQRNTIPAVQCDGFEKKKK